MSWKRVFRVSRFPPRWFSSFDLLSAEKSDLAEGRKQPKNWGTNVGSEDFQRCEKAARGEQGGGRRRRFSPVFERQGVEKNTGGLLVWYSLCAYMVARTQGLAGWLAGGLGDWNV